MAKFYGEVGFGETVESPGGSGVYKEVITEKSFFGDVVRNTRQVISGDKVNDDLSVNNSISIIAGPEDIANIFAIRYVKWMGGYFIVPDVDVVAPRLILRLGGVYNGPKAAAPGSSSEAIPQ